MGPPVKMMKKREIVKEYGPNHRVIHVVIAPPILSQRENVVEWKREELNDKESLLSIESVLCDEVPIKEDIIRVLMYKAQVIRQCEENPADLIISDVSSVDMKGSIPTRLLNMALTTMMTKAMHELVQHIRTEIQGKA
jgi:hypothetical protein